MFRWKAMVRYFRNGKIGGRPLGNCQRKRVWFKVHAVLVQHIINWRVFVLRKLKGDVGYDLIIDGPNDWSEVHINSLQEWNELKRRLRQTQTELLEILSAASVELLEKKVPGKKYTFENVLPSLAQHDIYHLGQIAMLNALQGS